VTFMMEAASRVVGDEPLPLLWRISCDAERLVEMALRLIACAARHAVPE